MTYQDYDRLLSFDSVHHAIKAEKILSDAGIPAYALPTPRQIDISCGQCLLFAAAQENKLLSLLTGHKVRWAKLFSRVPAGNGTYIYEKINDYGG
ncbi:DUF3343 domain-containing protein [Sporomusa carbonis]|uniref:DUF3343 domain-containing protein n=1 Tax=Sporomusa carbonis TaxID=3076075 RepID=UPI003C7E9D84